MTAAPQPTAAEAAVLVLLDAGRAVAAVASRTSLTCSEVIAIGRRYGREYDTSARTMYRTAAAADYRVPAAAGASPCTYEPDLFFSVSPADVEAAKALCARCPARAVCLADAMMRQEPEGVWGGEQLSNGKIARPRRPRPGGFRSASAAVAAAARRNVAELNRARGARAAAEACERARAALAVLGPGAPAHLVAAAQLRLAHPGLTLPELAGLSDEPLTKDTLAGRIRRLTEMAERKAGAREVAA